MIRRKNCAALVMALVGISCLSGRAQELFTTQDDFSGWQDNNNGTYLVGAPVATPDSDGSTTNGVGNTSNAGGTGTAGSEQITWLPAAAGYSFFYSPGEQNNTNFLSAIDPGSSAGNLVSFSGVIKLDSTLPTGSLGVILNYNSNFSQIFGSNSATTNANGFYTTTIPYTINAVTGLSYFQFGIIYNSSYDNSFDIDNIRLSNSALVTFSDVSANWTSTSSGNWETATNWSSNPSVPGATGSQVFFGTVSGASNQVVTLSQPASVEWLNFASPDGSAAGGYTINNGSSGSLNISSVLEADSGTNTINVPVTFSGGVGIYINPDTSLTIPSVSNSGQYGTFALTANDGSSLGGTFSEGGMMFCSVDANGTWNILSSMSTSLSSPQEFFGITVEANSLFNVGSHAINGNSLYGAGTVNIGSGGTLTLGYYNSETFFNGSFTGSGALIFTGAVTNTPGQGATPQYIYGSSPSFSGPITVNAGDTLGFQSNSALGNGSATNTVTLDNGILQAIGSCVGSQNIIITANGGTIDTDGPAGGTGDIIPGGCAITLGAVSSTANGTLTKINAGELTVSKITGVSLVINGGTVQLAANGTSAGASSLNALALAVDSNNVPQGSLDITNNKVTIVAPAGSDPISTIHGYLLTAYDSGKWDGAGIFSSSVASQPGTGIGYADGNTDTGTSAASGTIVVMDTWLGDLNLDGSVTPSDLTTITANLGKNGDWSQGDLNYDGKINGDDLALFMLGSAEFKAGGSVPLPEPAVGSLLALAGLTALRRRRA
ncbi:MAG TPA: dockerin type I repeat-containing protein [Tepidisphaeraceae bacterium]|jgi:hypothetical protein